MRCLGLLAVAALLAAVATVRAHDLPLEVLTYVKVEAGLLRVLVRLPPAFLREAGLPVRSDGYLDRQAAEAPDTRGLPGQPLGPLAAVASDVARTLDVMAGARPLTASGMSWRISPGPDAAFDTYESAAARMAAPPLPFGVGIDPGTALVDVQLDYPMTAVDDRVSIRVNGFRANRPSRMQVRYVTTTGATRTIITTGPAQRVELEPRWQATGLRFTTLGVEQLIGATLPLLFILSLAIPLRPIWTTLEVFGAFAISWTVALTIAALLPASFDQASSVVFQRLAAAVLVVAALQNITGARLAWVRIAAIGFGLAVGLAHGLAYRASAALAGTHRLLALLAFGGPILMGWVWLLMVAQPIAGLGHRFLPGPMGPGLLGSGLRGRWALILLSAVVIHAALHGIVAGR